jgi:hypothetical protein
VAEFILSIVAVIRVFLRSRSDTALEVLVAYRCAVADLGFGNAQALRNSSIFTE